MRKIALLLLMILSLSAIGIPVALAETDAPYVDVAAGKPTGGKQYNAGSWEGLMYPANSLVDGMESTYAAFYISRFQGYMYIDLGVSYQIDHIDVLAYNTASYTRCGDYDIVVGNTEPDEVPFDPANTVGEKLVASVPMDPNAGLETVGYKTFTVDGGSYRYVSFEKLQDNSDGLMIREVKVYVARENMPEYVEVAQGKPVGGGGNVAPVLFNGGEQLVDGDFTTKTGFYAQNIGNSGHMYIDLGAAYKIDHIEVVAYHDGYGAGERVGDYDLVVSNTVPDTTPVGENPNKALVTHVGKDFNALTAETGMKTYSLPADIAGNAYRYVSFEKLQDNSYGLLIAEVKVYVLKDELPFAVLSNTVYSYQDNQLSITANMINGGNDAMVFLLKSYDESGAVRHIMAHEVSLETYVTDAVFSTDIDLSAFSLTENTKIDLVAVDSLTELNPILFIENVLSEGRVQHILNTAPEIAFSATAVQEGIDSKISGTASGSAVLITLFNPGKGLSGLSAGNVNEYLSYFGIAQTDSVSGAFEKTVSMPNQAISGTYTAVLGLVSRNEPISNRTKSFAFTSIIDDFQTVTESNFVSVVQQYASSYTELLPALNARSATIGESFLLAKESFSGGQLHDEVKALNTISAIDTMIRAAILVDDTRQKTEFSDSLQSYRATMPKIFFDTYLNTEEFESVLNSIKTTTIPLNSAQNIIKAYQTAAALSAVLNGSRTEIAWAIQTFADALGIDITAVETANVSYNDIAKKIANSQTAVENYIVNGMGSVVTQAMNEVLAENTIQVVPSRPIGGGGGGGGTAIRVPPMIEPQPTVQPDINEKTAETEENKAPFADLDGYQWAVSAIAQLSEQELLNGVGDGKFLPGAKMTREQVAKLIVLAFNYEGGSEANVFTDCAIEGWYYPYVTAASSNGVIKGIERTFFGVGYSITRQDIAVMLDRALQQRGVMATANDNVFSDAAETADYAIESVNRLAAMGIVTGMEDGSFRPKAYITRAEVAVMFDRILKLL